MDHEWLYRNSIVQTGSDLHTWMESSAVSLRSCWHLHYCIPPFWAWVGLLWKRVVCVWASWPTLERHNSGFCDLSQGREKWVSMAYQDRIRAERQGDQKETLCQRLSLWGVIPKSSQLENLVATDGQGHSGRWEWCSQMLQGRITAEDILIWGYLKILAFLLDHNSELGKYAHLTITCPPPPALLLRGPQRVPGAPEPISTTQARKTSFV